MLAKMMENMSVDKDWQNLPPYGAVKGEAVFEKKHEGSCHCGKVRYWLSRDKPLTAKYCHCRECQILHGAPFQWAAIFHKEDMLFERGIEGLSFYHSAEHTLGHELPCKVSCTYCRTPIMDEGRRMALIFPTLIKFENKAQRDMFYPDCHIFYAQRIVDILDGKPKWRSMDGTETAELLVDMP
ncbi:Mss4-like protein [Xylariales sp. PMI_506]|nr:Mss4-like protein [Xylariales sp. PMI_506]